MDFTGIIFFLIELYVISHTYESEYSLIKRDSNSYRNIYGIIEGSEEKLPLTVGRLLVLIVANIIPVVNILYFLFFIGWWIKRASDPKIEKLPVLSGDLSLVSSQSQ